MLCTISAEYISRDVLLDLYIYLALNVCRHGDIYERGRDNLSKCLPKRSTIKKKLWYKQTLALMHRR